MLHRFKQFICLLLLSAFAHSSVFAATAKTGTSKPAIKPIIKLFLQENLDIHGRPLPLDRDLEDILIYFEHESGIQFDKQILPWNRAQLMAQNGEGIIFGISRSPERLQLYHFSIPVVSEKIWAITYGDPRPNFQTVEDLRGKTVSVGRGFSHGMDFEKAKNVVFQVQEDSASSAARFKKLMNRRSDIMLWPVRQLQRASQVEAYLRDQLVPSFNDPELTGKTFYVSAKPVFYDTTHFAAANGKYEAEMDKLNAVIRKGTANGKLPKVLAKFY
ncbi:substrate-binding periplasmic protein [Undibacterium pigrum]|uniref:ABC-type amino acid transport substrate-binding protein n=1 Tax=Undibacterium pigrum TaxID=401470 RepID=A0A318JH22_9BURK|nr:transporter substrate-binding domain-containing protein [Undibacterium pigrum]PXX46512.1 ABC-type amino acid transport substrate-binding protein [Undibacterium pigrum]